MIHKHKEEWREFLGSDAGKKGVQAYRDQQTKRAVSASLSEEDRARALHLLWGLEGFLKSINATLSGDQE